MSLIVINSGAFLDEDTHSVSIQFDRVTFTIIVEEFLDFYDSISDVKKFLENSPDYVVGHETDSLTGSIKKVIIPKPDDSEYT